MSSFVQSFSTARLDEDVKADGKRHVGEVWLTK